MQAEDRAAAIHHATQAGMAHYQAGRLAEAERAYRQVLQIDPDNAVALHLLGIVAHQSGDNALSLQLIDRAVTAKADFALAFNSRGNVMQVLGRFDEALASYDRAVALRPDYADAWCHRGNVLKVLGRCEEALASCDRALALRPGHADALSNRGNALKELGRYDEAIASFDSALAMEPGFAEALSNRGNALKELRRYEDALASYDRALALRPGFAEALNNRGNVLNALKRHAEALANLDKALAIKPRYAEALSNRGNALYELKRTEEAVASWHGALKLKTDYVEAHSCWIYGRQHLCDWAGLEKEVGSLRGRVIRDKSGKVVPFIFLALPAVQASEQLSCARQYADETYGKFLSRPPLCGELRRRGDARKLRVGYLSSDFQEHPVSYLLAEVIELHDRDSFEIFGYSCGHEDASAMRRRMHNAFDAFLDVAPLSDSAAAKRILEDRIDILVELNGYTQNSRLSIAALRPAPVQVNWLGYPGTLGEPRLADYLIGDPIVSPLEHAAHFSEALALMPNCFQANDRQRPIGTAPHRTTAGLPAQGFVYCCFNQSYKITQSMFDLWCRLLAQVPGSVLWLLGESDTVKRNLQREALQRGVTPERLIFAPRVTYAEHLARFQLADLFLDTLPFNAGATGNDALWAGVPLVTCQGEAFAGRMAASLLNAAGLPELVAHSLPEYEALALALATDGTLLAATRARLARNRDTSPLFDSKRFTHDLERLYRKMWTDHCTGRKAHILLRE